MYNLSLSSHYTFVANREAVRVYSQAGVMLGAVADAKRVLQGKSERQPSGAVYQGVNVDWRLPHIQVTFDVTPGCFIVDSDGLAFTVLAADSPGTYDGGWHCRCLSLLVVGSTITWHLPANQTDAFGSPIIDQSATLATTLAGISELACEAVIFQGIVQGFRRTYAIWVVGDVALELGCVGIDQAGKVYTVTAIRNRAKINELLQVEAVIQP